MRRNKSVTGKYPLRYAMYIVLFLLLASALAAFVFAQAFSDNYIIPRDVLDTGGGRDSSTNYIMEESIGQSTPIGESGSTNYRLYAGFQIPFPCEPVAPTNATIIANRDSLCNYQGLAVIRWTPSSSPFYNIYRSTTDPFAGFTRIGTVPTAIDSFIDPIGANTKAFYYVTGSCDSLGEAPESDPSNRIGFVSIVCPQTSYTPFGLPFTFWDVVNCVPQYGVPTCKPSDIIGAQFSAGSGATGDRVIRQDNGLWAYRTTTPALWAGPLEIDGCMECGRAFNIWNRHSSAQTMVLAGEVDTSACGPIWIAPNAWTPLSFRDARVRPIRNINLLTSGFTGGTGATSDRLIEQGTGSYAFFSTGSMTWVYYPTSFTSVSPGKAYRIWNRHGTGWNYNYGSGPVSRPPDRPDDNRASSH